MLARTFLYKKQLWSVSYNCTCHRAIQQSANQVQETINLETRLSAPLKKLPQRKPFAKNLFLGVFDHELMYYPEPQTKARNQEFVEWLKPIENYMLESQKDPHNVKKDDLLSNLKDMGVFRAHVNEQYLGLDMGQTELAKLVETLGCFPWLSSYLVKNYIQPIHIITKLASDVQKAKYLPKIISGEIRPTICFTESKDGAQSNYTTTEALLSDCHTHWILNGKKSFVINGHDSNLFLVFTQCALSRNQTMESTPRVLSVLLVEKDCNGITCTDTENTVGQQENSVSTISFQDTKVPKENLLGEIGSGLNLLMDLLCPGSRDIGPQAIGILKTFIKLLTNDVLQRKHLDKNLYEYEAVQEVLGKMATTLYAMESMLYMTTGIIDMYEEQDCALEKAMTEFYCASECAACIYEGLQIMGARSYLRSSPYIKMFEDALSYILFDSYNIDSCILVSLLGLQYAGKNLHQHISKLRNAFHYPRYVLRTFFNSEYQIKLQIADHMHPSLQEGGEILEKCITKLHMITVRLLQKHGLDISDRHMELRRLSELATRTFALVSVLSRASRAYCIGLRNAEYERQIAGSLALLTLDRIGILEKELHDGEYINGDKLYKNIVKEMYDKRDYLAEHPLNRSY